MVLLPSVCPILSCWILDNIQREAQHVKVYVSPQVYILSLHSGYFGGKCVDRWILWRYIGVGIQIFVYMHVSDCSLKVIFLILGEY